MAQGVQPCSLADVAVQQGRGGAAAVNGGWGGGGGDGGGGCVSAAAPLSEVDVAPLAQGLGPCMESCQLKQHGPGVLGCAGRGGARRGAVCALVMAGGREVGAPVDGRGGRAVVLAAGSGGEQRAALVSGGEGVEVVDALAREGAEARKEGIAAEEPCAWGWGWGWGWGYGVGEGWGWGYGVGEGWGRDGGGMRGESGQGARVVRGLVGIATMSSF
jgi:hypothetical protein